MSYRQTISTAMVIIAAYCGFATAAMPFDPVARSPAFPICFVLALGFSALLRPSSPTTNRNLA
jgi:formate-dependent nitrite reductase membrane component NrfD